MARRVDPGAEWAPMRAEFRNDAHENEPALHFSDGTTAPMRIVRGQTGNLLRGDDPADRDPMAVTEFLLHYRPIPELLREPRRRGRRREPMTHYPPEFPPGLVEAIYQPGPSILLDLPPAPQRPLPPWPTLTPDQGGPLHPLPGDPTVTPTDPDAPDAPVRTDELYLYRGKITHLQHRPGRLKPLDPTTIDTAFRAIALTPTDHDPATDPPWHLDLTTDHDPSDDHEDMGSQQFTTPDGDATVDTFVHHGAVRALALQLHNTPPDQAAALLDAYHALAKTLKATITPDHQINWP
jgi:hypothetical protein